MDLTPQILGTGVVKQLEDRLAAPVLRIGSDTFRRSDLASVACFNFIAAANVSRLMKVLDVKNTRDVFDNVGPSMLAVPTMGAISLAVLGAAFEYKGLGGDQPLKNWVLQHAAPNGNSGARRKRTPLVTFETLKTRAADHTERDRKARKRARRNQAHETRVRRFLERQEQ